MKEDIVNFTVKCSMKSRWVPQFLTMLSYMEFLGDVGSSRQVALYADGDGDFRPKFDIDIDFKKVDPVSDEDGDHLYDAG